MGALDHQSRGGLADRLEEDVEHARAVDGLGLGRRRVLENHDHQRGRTQVHAVAQPVQADEALEPRVHEQQTDRVAAQGFGGLVARRCGNGVELQILQQSLDQGPHALVTLDHHRHGFGGMHVLHVHHLR